jgi:hypothetical protein
MSKTFVQEFEDLRDRAMALGETYNREVNEILTIACQCDGLMLSAKAGDVPYGGSFAPWSAFIEETTARLDRYERAYASGVKSDG